MVYYIGTSGEMDLSKDKWFSLGFNSLEVNYTFYKQPKDDTFIKWKEQSPKSFKYTIKVNKFITHMKKLVDFNEVWEQYWNGYQLLGNKLGCLLFQFPPGLKNSSHKGVNNLTPFQRLENMCKHLRKITDVCIAIEFRDMSWFIKEIIQLLKKYNIALVIDVTKEDRSYFGNMNPDIFPNISTANYSYIRLHGSKGKFKGRYSDDKLNEIKNLLKKFNNKTNFIYFNNTFLSKGNKNCSINNMNIKRAAICDALKFKNII